MKTVVVSGYFNPLHKGHIDYINAAKKLGDHLIIIVNNDRQQLLKKGKIIMDEDERMLIMSNLKGVNKAVLSIDTDRSVVQTLEMLAENYSPIVFANGGDRTADEIPEMILTGKYGIEFVFGVGGEKVTSSSNINRLLEMD